VKKSGETISNSPEKMSFSPEKTSMTREIKKISLMVFSLFYPKNSFSTLPIIK
jgi:hypothetical protein